MIPQSNVPSTQFDNNSYLRMSVFGRKLNVSPPLLVVNNGLALRDKANIGIRGMQNCGTVPVKWMVGDDPSGDSFHGIMVPCATQDDGTSLYVDFSHFQGDIYILGVGGNPRVAVFETTLT